MATITTTTHSYNIPGLANTDIRVQIPILILSTVPSQCPFTPVPDIFNLRDLAHTSTPNIRPDLVYCSGGLNSLSDTSKALLAKDLNVKTNRKPTLRHRDRVIAGAADRRREFGAAAVHGGAGGH